MYHLDLGRLGYIPVAFYRKDTYILSNVPLLSRKLRSLLYSVHIVTSVVRIELLVRTELLVMKWLRHHRPGNSSVYNKKKRLCADKLSPTEHIPVRPSRRFNTLNEVR